jgi:hypothetical protein
MSSIIPQKDFDMATILHRNPRRLSFSDEPLADAAGETVSQAFTPGSLNRRKGLSGELCNLIAELRVLALACAENLASVLIQIKPPRHWCANIQIRPLISIEREPHYEAAACMPELFRYRLTSWRCRCRVAGVHMAKSLVGSRNPLESPRAPMGH